MKLLIQIIFLVIPLAFSAPAFAQDYTISEKSDRINSAKYDGYAIQVSGPLEKVTDQIYNYLKERSKVRRKRNYYSVTEFKMDKLSLDSTEVFLKISDKDNGSQLWMATETLGLNDERVDEINKSIREELVLMARSYYVHQQELKIHEAEAAAQVISKKQQNLIEQHSSLTKSLEEAEARKIELENMLEANKLKIASLKQQIIDNKAEQDTTYINLQKVNSVIEGHKEALKRIN
ncbi:MAG: hypothetical protein KDC79_02000 [Cyclobacteriaceae bacterium]|nr:hypothetical protein [Cyclobacteriaceae bacterium]